MTTDLQKAFDVINAKRPHHKLKWEYYDGNQPLVYSTNRLKEIFQNMNARFNQNWCAVVVDAVLDRLTLKGFATGNDAADKFLEEMFSAQHMELDADDVHTASQVTGEAFIIADKPEGGEVEIYYNDPRLCAMFYNPERPKEKSFAAKWWAEGKTNYMVLYYPDRMERYICSKAPQSYKSFKPDGDDFIETHDFGVIPVFHFRNERRKLKSVLQDVITLQDAINKLFSDMMVSAEFGAFKQRWAITDADVSVVKSRPGTILGIPPGDGEGQGTSVGEFTETNLAMFLDAIDRLAKSLSIIARIPKSYIMDTGAGISGDALVSMEAPLVKKAKSFQSAYSVTWIELADFILDQNGMSVPEADITAKWDVVDSVQPYTQSQARKTNIDAGLPLVTQLRNEGWTESQIQSMLDDAQAQEERDSTLAKALLEQARIESEQNNDVSE